jgi:hypothetical protein
MPLIGNHAHPNRTNFDRVGSNRQKALRYAAEAHRQASLER